MRSMGLAGKLFTLVVLVPLVLLLVVALGHYVADRNVIQGDVSRQAEEMCQRIAMSIQYPLYDHDHQFIRRLIESEFYEESVESIVVYEEHGNGLPLVILTRKDGAIVERPQLLPQRDLIQVERDVVYQTTGEQIGRLVVRLDTKPRSKELLRTLGLRLLELFLVLVVVGAVFLAVLHKFIVLPIERISRAMGFVGTAAQMGVVDPRRSSGVILAHQPITGFREVQQVGWAMKKMTDSLGAQQELVLQVEKQLEATLDALTDGVVSMDMACTVVRANPVACRILDVQAELARGQQFLSLVPPGEAAVQLTEAVKEVISKHRIIRIEAELHFGEVAVHAVVAPVKNGADELEGVVLVLRDVTELVRYQQRMLQAEKMESIGRLAGGVAHDFNNMLGGIQGCVEVLEGQLDNPSAKAQRMLAGIKRSVDRAASLTKQLLLFSRSARNTESDLDMRDCIEHAVGLLRRTIDPRVVIHVDCLDIEGVVVGDVNQWENAFINLGINASDAMPEGGKLTFSLRATSDDCALRAPKDRQVMGAVVIQVADTGTGIPAENQAHIFDPFFTTKELGKGTGLGLASVYGTVCDHGGRIECDSEVGLGTTFSIYLPLVSGRPASTGLVTLQPVNQGGCVLVVDDEELLRDTATQMLEALGYRTLEAENGRRALEVYADHQQEIDLVLLDLRMPEMDGATCLTCLMNMDPSVRVVVASGYGGDAQRENLLEAGACAYLDKPYSLDQLSRQVAEVLSGQSGSSFSVEQ